jgi:hypothetical protein
VTGRPGSVLRVRRGWFSPRAIGMHITLAVLVPGCAALCDWQIHRALSGNGLSWAYVFEWPFFAGYGVYVWWRLVHDQLAPVSPAEPGPLEGAGPTAAPEPTKDDEELAAYNRYLAGLQASGRQKRWSGQ